MQQHQSKWSASNNNPNTKRRSDFSENRFDQNFGSYQDNRQLGSFEQRNDMNNGCNRGRNESYSQESSSPYSSDGSQFGQKINEYHKDYQPKRFEQRKEMEESPSQCCNQKNVYYQGRRDYSPRRAPNPSINYYELSNSRRFNSSRSTNISPNLCYNPCNNERRNDYSPRKPPSPRDNYQEHLEQGRYNYSDSRSRLSSPCYSPCNNGGRSPILDDDYEHQDEQRSFGRWHSPNRSLGSGHRNSQRRLPSPSNQGNFRRWRSPNRSPSPDDNRCEMKREQDDFQTIKTNFNYKPFGYQNSPPQTRHYATEDNTESQCIYCNRHHLSDMCPAYPVVAVRRIVLVQKHICHICLQSNQGNHRCEIVEACYYCKRTNHHYSVCHFPVLHTYCEEELAVFKEFALRARLRS